MRDQDQGRNPSEGAVFARLLTANHRRLHAFTLALVANAADADDVMQDASGVLWEKFASFDREAPDSDFAAWAMAVIRIIVMRHHRSRHRRSMLPLSDELVGQIADDAAALSGEFEARREALAVCLGKLTADDRRFITWRYDEDLPVKVAAQRLGVSPQAVYKSLTRVHDALHRCILLRLREGGER